MVHILAVSGFSLQQYLMALSTSPFATVFCKYVCLKKMIFIWKESHVKGYIVTLIKSLWLSPPLATDHPDTLGKLLNIYNIQIF